MLFQETAITDAYIINVKRLEDSRGYFAILWSQHAFEERGLDGHFIQANLSFNRYKGTLRGMHFQQPPYAQTKLIRCLRGAVYDVVIDIRPDSPTYRQWVGVELTAESQQAFYVPRGLAHGFQTLADDTEIVYHVAQAYAPQAESGIRYDDPAFDINWPLPVSEISEKDRRWPAFLPAEA